MATPRHLRCLNSILHAPLHTHPHPPPPAAPSYEADIDRFFSEGRAKAGDLLGHHSAQLRSQARNLAGQGAVMLKNIQQKVTRAVLCLGWVDLVLGLGLLGEALFGRAHNNRLLYNGPCEV